MHLDKGLRILLVCEDSDAYKLILESMKMVDDDAQLLSCGLENYKIVNLEFDAAILEFDQKDSIQNVFASILNFKKNFEVPLFVMMDRPSSKDQIVALTVGASSVIEKPINKYGLSKQIEDLLSWAWYYRWKNSK